jgi:hypothetical protein
MLGLLSFLLNIAVIGIVIGAAVGIFVIGRAILNKTNSRRGDWKTYTETARGQIVVGIQRKVGFNRVETQVMKELPLSTAVENPDLLYTSKAQASETAMALNVRRS